MLYDNEEIAKAKSLFLKLKNAAKVNAECEMIFNLNDFKSGLMQFLELEEKYPEEKETIQNMVDKFIKGNH